MSTDYAQGEHLVLDGQKLFPMKSGDPIMIMNLPVGVESTEKHVVELLIDKARAKLYGIRHILTSNAPIKSRMKILRTVVYGNIRWVVGILLPTKQLQFMLNHFECQCVRRMLGAKRRSREEDAVGTCLLYGLGKACRQQCSPTS